MGAGGGKGGKGSMMIDWLKIGLYGLVVGQPQYIVQFSRYFQQKCPSEIESHGLNLENFLRKIMDYDNNISARYQ